MEDAGNSVVDVKPKSTRKGKSKSSDTAKGKRSLNLSLPVEVYEKLVIHAMRQTNNNISDLVCKLVNDNLRDFHITRTASRSES